MCCGNAFRDGRDLNLPGRGAWWRPVALVGHVGVSAHQSIPDLSDSARNPVSARRHSGVAAHGVACLAAGQHVVRFSGRLHLGGDRRGGQQSERRSGKDAVNPLG